jgi:16S rRNA G966 N2-methylase RsmD
MLKVLKKIYPEPKDKDYSKLNYDEEGLWSITHPNDADKISKTILQLSNKFSKIIDLTAGCGGNLISFGKYFENVTGIELSIERYQILKNNIKSYNYNINIINDDCIKYLNKNYDIYFIDPPWGGPDYKLVKNLKLYLSNMELKEIIKKIKNKIVVLKIPYNYNYDYIKQNYKILLIQKYNNINIIYFNT